MLSLFSAIAVGAAGLIIIRKTKLWILGTVIHVIGAFCIIFICMVILIQNVLMNRWYDTNIQYYNELCEDIAEEPTDEVLVGLAYTWNDYVVEWKEYHDNLWTNWMYPEKMTEFEEIDVDDIARNPDLYKTNNN